MSPRIKKRKCAVQTCDYNSDRGLFRIPEHPKRRQYWIDACKLSPPYTKLGCKTLEYRQSKFEFR